VKIAIAFIGCIMGTSCWGQSGQLQATNSEVKVTICQRASANDYQLSISTRFAITNDGNRSVLIAKRVDVIPAIRIATTEENAKKGVFRYNINEEYSGNAASVNSRKNRKVEPIPQSATRAVNFASVELSLDSNHDNQSELRIAPGKYWMVFGYSAIPLFYQQYPSSLKSLKQFWSNRAVVSDQIVWTKPFPFDVEVPTSTRACPPVN
jgi:hypothetical protein